jgi:uncharacterized protein (TIGR01244 family)
LGQCAVNRKLVKIFIISGFWLAIATERCHFLATASNFYYLAYWIHDMLRSVSHPSLTWITPQFAVTSALAAEDFAALASRGIASIISNRPDGEEAGQLSAKTEAALAWRAGMLFRHVPAAKYDLFTDEVVEGMADALRGLKGPVVAHCKSGIRSAIVWAAASARSQPVNCVLEALVKAGLELDSIRDDLDGQADRKRWLGVASALDCNTASGSRVEALAKPRSAA